MAHELEARLAEAETELASLFELEAALGAVIEDRDNARAERDEALRALDAARAELSARQAEIVDLRGSTSWRVTSPLRRLSARLRGGPRV